jgi:hypothetical protein
VGGREGGKTTGRKKSQHLKTEAINSTIQMLCDWNVVQGSSKLFDRVLVF